MWFELDRRLQKPAIDQISYNKEFVVTNEISERR